MFYGKNAFSVCFGGCIFPWKWSISPTFVVFDVHHFPWDGHTMYPIPQIIRLSILTSPPRN